VTEGLELSDLVGLRVTDAIRLDGDTDIWLAFENGVTVTFFHLAADCVAAEIDAP
jgi:hypothetical protein